MCMKVTTAYNHKVLTGYEDGSIALWDCRKPDGALSRLKVHSDPVMCLDYNSVTETGFSGSATECISSWTIDSDQISLKQSVNVTNPGFNDCRVRTDGKFVVFAGWDSNIRLFSGKTLKPLAVLKYHKDSVYCIAFSEENLMACGSKDQQISLWDVYR